ncbi:uncharacterized protein LOC108093566 [Trichonephila clavipes]|nr:uncharacterized protein LOC108093566 [Trichonephila clavipes]
MSVVPGMRRYGYQRMSGFDSGKKWQELSAQRSLLKTPLILQNMLMPGDNDTANDKTCYQGRLTFYSPKNWEFRTISQLATFDEHCPSKDLGLPPYTIITLSIKRRKSVKPVCAIVQSERKSIELEKKGNSNRVNNRKRKRSDAERAQEYRARKTANIQSSDSTIAESINSELFSNAIIAQVYVHHRHCSQLSASIATTNNVCVNGTQVTSDLSSIHRDSSKKAAERMQKYRVRKNKENPIVNHRNPTKSDKYFIMVEERQRPPSIYKQNLNDCL